METIQFIPSVQKTTARRPPSKWIDYGRETKKKTSKEAQVIIVGRIEEKVSIII